MGSLNVSSKKNFLLYGLSGSGKTLLLYQMHSEQQIAKNVNLCHTVGINYEEITLKHTKLGIFDLSGSNSNHNLLNLICKSVEIHGIIFVMKISDMDRIQEAKDALETVLGNNYLMPNPCLFIIYNKNKNDNYNWVNSELLDSKLGIEKLTQKYGLRKPVSQIVDISQVKSENPPEGLYQLEMDYFKSL